MSSGMHVASSRGRTSPLAALPIPYRLHTQLVYQTCGPRRQSVWDFSRRVPQPSSQGRQHCRDRLRSKAADGGSSSGAECEGASPPEDSSIQLSMPRRSRMVTFTCNKCDGTTSRMVNPIAWDKGLVFVQCGQCKAWHKIQDAAGLIDEIRYADEDEESSLSSSAEAS